jgi:hypothetical protein
MDATEAAERKLAEPAGMEYADWLGRQKRARTP